MPPLERGLERYHRGVDCRGWWVGGRVHGCKRGCWGVHARPHPRPMPGLRWVRPSMHNRAPPPTHTHIHTHTPVFADAASSSSCLPLASTVHVHQSLFSAHRLLVCAPLASLFACSFADLLSLSLSLSLSVQGCTTLTCKPCCVLVGTYSTSRSASPPSQAVGDNCNPTAHRGG